MTWKKFRLLTIPKAEDLISALLADLGIAGVEIEDHVPLTKEECARMFVDIPLAEEDDGYAYVTFYLSETDDEESLLSDFQAGLADLRQYADLGPCTLERSQTEEEDWVNNWKQYFHAFEVADLLITPSWEHPEPKEGQIVIHMDPGTAFGTGSHETTRLCIQAIRQAVRPKDTVLDVGCGSGILGLVALKLGAAYSVGTDLDENAIRSTRENMERNGIGPVQYQVLLGNLIDDPTIQAQVGVFSYDLVLANILPDVLVPLLPVVVRVMKPGAVCILSGILAEKEARMAEAVKSAGLCLTETTRMGEWVALTTRKE